MWDGIPEVVSIVSVLKVLRLYDVGKIALCCCQPSDGVRSSGTAPSPTTASADLHRPELQASLIGRQICVTIQAVSVVVRITPSMWDIDAGEGTSREWIAVCKSSSPSRSFLEPSSTTIVGSLILAFVASSFPVAFFVQPVDLFDHSPVQRLLAQLRRLGQSLAAGTS
jgi:hypothetical protein